MFTIAKRFHFSASHQLPQMGIEHKCARLHGHNYIVEVVLTGSAVDTRGVVMDYGDLDVFKQFLDGEVDHRHLNDIMDQPPTAENLACWFYVVCEYRMKLPVSKVRVYETPDTWAEYTK